MSRFFLVYIWLTAVIAFYILKVYILGRNIYYSNETLRLEKSISQLKTENLYLEVQLSHQESLQFAKEWALQMGFTEPKPGQLLFINARR